MTTLRLMFASEERAEIARRMHRGKQRKLEQGIYCLPSVSYGLKRETDKNQRPPKHTISLDETEYENLRLDYELIVNQGKSLHYCCDYLNAQGRRTRRGKLWTPGNLSRILSQQCSLTGTIMTNRFTFEPTGRVNAQGKPLLKRTEKPREEWRPIKVPAIFTEEEYRLLKASIKANRSQASQKKKRRERFLLSRKLKCGICGRGYRTILARASDYKGKRYAPIGYYACRGRVEAKWLGEKCARSPWVNAAVLDREFERELFVRLFMFPKVTLKRWGTVDKAKEKRRLKQLSQKIKEIDKRLMAKDREMDKLLDAAIQEMFTKEKIVDKKREIDRGTEFLQDQRTDLEIKLEDAERLQFNLKAAEQHAEGLKQLSKRLQKKLLKIDILDKQRLLGYFIPEGSYVEIHPLHPDDYHRVKLKGKRHTNIKWQYHYWGWANLAGFIEALEMWDKTGRVRDTIRSPAINNNL